MSTFSFLVLPAFCFCISTHGLNLPPEVEETDAGGETFVSLRRDLNWPVVSWKGLVSQKTREREERERERERERDEKNSVTEKMERDNQR